MPLPFLSYTDDELFPLVYGALAGHCLLILAPAWKHTPIVTLLIAGFYAILYVMLLTQTSADQQPSGASFNTLAGVIRLLSDRQNVFIAWVHFTSFDLMVSRWIVADAWSQNVPHFIAACSIPITCFLGPAGMICYLGLKSGYITLLKNRGIRNVPPQRKGNLGKS